MALLLLVLSFPVPLGTVWLLRRLKRPIPFPYLAFFWFLPLLFLFPCFFQARTALPVDQAMSLPPWNTGHATVVHNPTLNDVVTQLVPWWEAVRIAWKEGSLPLRDRWNGCGSPLAANGQSEAFSPFALLTLPLPLAYASTLAIHAKLFLALAGMWLWLVEVKLSRAGALFGAVSFAFSLGMTAFALFPLVSVACLWPWVLFAVELLRDDAIRGRAFPVLVTALVLLPLCGHPESVAVGMGFVGFWLLTRWLAKDLPDARVLFGRISLAAVIAVGLSAFLLLPQAMAIASSNRLRIREDFLARMNSSVAPHGPLWPNGLIASFFPRALGDAIGSPMIEGAGFSLTATFFAYAGILGWALALSIVRPGARRRPAEWALFVALLFGLAVTAGLWPLYEIFVRLPVVRTMSHLSLARWVSLAGAAIAAFEVDRLREDVSNRPKAATVWFLAVAGLLSVMAMATFFRFRKLHAASGGLPSQRKALVVCLIVLGCGALAILFLRRSTAPSALALVLTAVSGAELFYQGRRVYSFGSPADLFPDTPLISFLRSRPGPFRILGEGPVMFPNTNVFVPVEDIRTHDPIERRDYLDFLDAACGYDPAQYFREVRDVNSPALDRLGVRYLLSRPGRAAPGEKWSLVYSGSDGTIFENRSALPRIHAIASEHAASVAISDYRETTNEISFRTRVLSAGGETLVVSVVQDGGWRAADAKGATVKTGRAPGPLVTLRLPPGEHRILMSYSPPGFRTGAGVALGTASILAVAWAAKRRRSVWRGGSEVGERMNRS